MLRPPSAWRRRPALLNKLAPSGHHQQEVGYPEGLSYDLPWFCQCHAVFSVTPALCLWWHCGTVCDSPRPSLDPIPDRALCDAPSPCWCSSRSCGSHMLWRLLHELSSLLLVGRVVLRCCASFDACSVGLMQVVPVHWSQCSTRLFKASCCFSSDQTLSGHLLAFLV